MQNEIYSEISNLILTKDDLAKVNSELDLLEKGLYETKENTFNYVLQNLISDDLASLILTLLNNESKENVIKNIRQKLSEIKILEITFAINPSRKFLESIINIIKQGVLSNQSVALDIKVDQDLIGGAKIIFEGKYYDGSLKTKLGEVLKNYGQL